MVLVLLFLGCSVPFKESSLVKLLGNSRLTISEPLLFCRICFLQTTAYKSQTDPRV